MKLTDVLADDNRYGVYPTIVTDADFSVVMYNDAAKAMIPELCEHTSIDDCLKLFDREFLYGLKYPATSIALYKEKEYFISVCPAEDGYDIKYVFFIAAPYGGEHYLSMKTAILSRFSCKTAARGKTGDSVFEASLRLLAAMSGDEISAVKADELLCDACSYYCRLRYKDDDNLRYRIKNCSDIVFINKAYAAALDLCFHLCLLLSANGYCEISSDSSASATVFRMEFKPCKRLCAAIIENGNSFRSFYRALGHEAEELYFIKHLTAGSGGGTVTGYDGVTQTAFIELSMSYGPGKYLKAFSADFSTVLRSAADYAACAVSQ